MWLRGRCGVAVWQFCDTQLRRNHPDSPPFARLRTGGSDWLRTDVRYLFYEDAAGFSFAGDSPFDTDGALTGFGWQKVFVFNIGAEYSASDKVAIRAGYNHGDSAVTEAVVSANLTSPAIVKDHVSFGLGWQPTRRFRIDAGYVVGFENSVTGPILGGSVAQTVTLTSSSNSFQLGFTL